MVCILHGYYEARPTMCFSLSSPPQPQKAIFSPNLSLDYECSRNKISIPNSEYHCQNFNNSSNSNSTNTNSNTNKIIYQGREDNMQRQEDLKNAIDPQSVEETSSDYKQWLHAMKLVARLPGGIPPEFRRKLWLSLADKYLKSKNVDWIKEEEKCFCDKWREDDEELGIQIVKDLHRTGSTLCTGPAGDLNQAKLKKILLGYTRYNPEVGYCQGFNMLGALILQVMDKDESESIKVMIYLVEGILPTGYFCGSMGGLQADMAVFRELMQTKLPRLAKHLQKLQGPVENAYEPPLTNVFTMQWFLTMFCTCLPMSCVLRVWDLVLIEGSDVLLRTALALWSLLEERVLSARSADDFYGKMGSFSSELLNGHLIDSNGLIEKVVQLGPIADIQKLRDKHLNNIAPIQHQQGLQLYYDDDEPDIDEDSRLAVATVWGIPWGRRGSQGQSNNNVAKQTIENKDRIALDISLLKKQYDKLRERQKQAHIILTTACTTASRVQSTVPNTSIGVLPVNQLLSGRPAIVTNRGRRSGPPTVAIPPARKPSLPAVLHDKPIEKQLRRGETLHWRDAKDTRHRRDSLSWKEIRAERAAMINSGSIDGLKSQKIRSGRLGKSDSSSYSEESDDNEADGGEASSTDTSLCDEDLQPVANSLKQSSVLEINHKDYIKAFHKPKKSAAKQRNHAVNLKENLQKARPKSWAPSNSEIPFVLMTTESPNNSADENTDLEYREITDNKILKKENDEEESKERLLLDSDEITNVNRKSSILPQNVAKLDISTETVPEKKPIDKIDLSPMSPITRQSNTCLMPNTKVTEKKDPLNNFASSLGSSDDISNEGVINEYFERVNSSERPTKLDLLYSLNEDENAKTEKDDYMKLKETSLPENIERFNSSTNIRCMDLLVDYSEKSSVACIEEAKTEISTTFHSGGNIAPISLKKDYDRNTNELSVKKSKGSFEKRRDPRRLTLTRSSTMEIEKRYQALEKRLSMEIGSKYKRFSTENENTFYLDSFKESCSRSNIKSNITNNMFSCDIDSEYDISVNRKIPSTADLEKRFESIQKQLFRDRSESVSKSPCDSDNAEQKANNSFDNISRKKTVQNNTEGTRKQEDLKENENSALGEEGKTTSIKHSDFEKNSPSSNGNNTIDTVSNTKISPSTNNSDSNIATSKTSTLQSKKEPPDDNEKERNTHDIDAKVDPNNSSSEIQTKSNIKDQSEPEENAAIQTLKENQEQHEEKEKEDSKIKSNRTSPPSTEELEKRFCALEEKMSSTKKETQVTKNNGRNDNPKKSEEYLHETVEQQVNGLAKREIPSNSTDTANDSKKELEQSTLLEKSTKRRSSEPPSTEDLEKRYEVLKRRMSTRNFEARASAKEALLFEDLMQQSHKITEIESPTHAVTNETSQQSPGKNSPPSTENLEKRFKNLQTKSTINKKSPPSTENLEKRFEKLQSKNDLYEATPQTKTIKEEQTVTQTYSHANTNKNSVIEKETVIESNESSGKPSDNITQKSDRNNMDVEVSSSLKKIKETSIDKKAENTSTSNANQIKAKLIEELQAKIKEHSTNIDLGSNVQKKMAVIEELKLKMKPLSDESVKPTQISSSRRPPVQIPLLPSKSFNDETLESHATSAYHRSGKYEPASSANRKMVRRFSDLPSRADLENRLLFLEEQLSKTVYMQRRSGDSEVASKVRYKNHNPTLTTVPLSESLEYRVQELEKRLNENKTLSMDIECTHPKDKNNKNDRDVEISQIELATDTVAVTGKELVRYSSYGDAGDTDHQNPINISINIQMTLNKDECNGNKKNKDTVTKTDDLDRRLLYLEQQLKSSQVPEKNYNVVIDVKEGIKNNDQHKICITEKTITDGREESEIDVKKIDEVEKFTNQIEEKHETENDCETPQNNVLESCQLQQDVHASTSKNHIEVKDTLEFIEQRKHMENLNQDETPSQVEKVINNENKNTLKTENKNAVEEIGAKENGKCEKQPIKSEIIADELKSDLNEISETNKDVEQKSCIEIGGNNSENKKETETEKNCPSSDLASTGPNTQFVPMEVNKKTLVLLLDNEPKAVKVRRLTRANTEELENLFQALEKQLNDRGQEKNNEKKAEIKPDELCRAEIETTKAMSELANEIEAFSKSDFNQVEQYDKKIAEEKQKKPDENFDWGMDPIKYHIKKKTVYLPSTKELEARFRSLERQIKFLEDVEKIDVEQRLLEIERKIKLQYSLSHEKDLNKFLELCEGKDVGETSTSLEKLQDPKECCNAKCTKHKSPTRTSEPINRTGNLEYRYRSLDLKKSKSKQNLKKQPIHPLEMLLDPSPDENEIPTTGELEHRIRVMEASEYTPSPPSRKSRSLSPPLNNESSKSRSNTHIFETMTASPTERELPTAEELEARLEALEKEQSFNYKMQKNFQQFNQKLKDVVSPSLSFDEIKSSTKHNESEPTKQQSLAPKQIITVKPISPKYIRFREEEHCQSLVHKENESMKPVAASYSGSTGSQQKSTVHEGLGIMGIRLMRETSPLRRKGTHTGVPLRTGENINDQLTSIQNTIKSIDSLCEEKPYRKEKCQQYIDALFSDSTYFAHKKSSLEDLTARNLSRSTSRDTGPYIRISDHSSAFSRSMGSADSIRSSSPVRSSSPLQFRSNRDLRREPSPRRRRDEDREEHESRVRRDNLLPNNNFSHSLLSHTSHSSLTKFHKVDSQLILNDVEQELEESLRHPIYSPIDNLKSLDNTNTSNNANTATPLRTLTGEVTTPELFKSHHLDKPISPFRQTILPNSNTPVYTPAKLEIRHTTVTSTFYDRVLTEKQLEKQHYNSVPTNSQSPLISPLFERHVQPFYQQQTSKSPQKNLNVDPLILTETSTGNYHRTYQSHIQPNNHG